MPTCPATISRNQRGFTLLEIMVVLGLVAAVIALGVPKLSSPNSKMRSSLRKLTAVSRQIHTHAQLHGALYRLVIDLGEGDGSPQSYWVERSTSRTVLSARDLEARQEGPISSEPREDQDEDAPPSDFTPAPRLGDRKEEIPSVLRIKDVEISSVDRPIDSGLAYIYFFPQGRVEEAVIHLQGAQKNQWTLSIHPLTGQSHLIPDHVSLRQLREP